MSFECQWFAGDKDDVGGFVAALHLELSFRLAFHPVRAGGVVQTCCGVCLAADVSCHDDGVAVCDGEIEETARLHVTEVVVGRDGLDEGVDLGDGLSHGATEDIWTEAAGRFGAGVDAFVFEGVEEEGEGPFGIGAAVDAEVPSVVQRVGERPFDIIPTADVAVVHPHQAVVLEGVAVVLREGAFGCGADVGEDEAGACLRCDAFEVHAVPGRQGGGKDAWAVAQVGFCVPADAEAVAVDWSALVQAKAGIV